MTSSPSPTQPEQPQMIPSIDHGGSGRPLHFLHANGYPPACYQPFLDLLKADYHAFGMLLRPLWPDARTQDLKDWIPLSEDLLGFLAQVGSPPVIAVGHSIGAIVSMRAALKRPDRFRALVLLDPVLSPPSWILMWNLARRLGLGHRLHPLIPGALRRRRRFDDLESVFQGYRRREVFRYLSDESLAAYVAGISRPLPSGGYELVYSPEWESHIYHTGVWRDMDLWNELPGLQVPALIIRGAETDTFGESAARLVKRRNPGIRMATLAESTHLLPLERPRQVFDIMQSYLEEIQ